MTNEPDLDSIMTRLLAEIAGVRSEVAGLRADLTAQKVLKGQWNKWHARNDDAAASPEELGRLEGLRETERGAVTTTILAAHAVWSVVQSEGRARLGMPTHSALRD